MKRLGIIVAILALLGAVAYGFRAQIAVQLMRTAAVRLMSTDAIAALPDGLHLTLCGAGSPLPDPERSGPCVGIVAGGKLFVVDAGSGAARNLTEVNLPPSEVAAVFVTHLHSDHIDGLGELGVLRWAGSNTSEPLPLYGPEGSQTVASALNAAYRIDAGYRVAHHGAETVPPSGAGYVARPFRAPAPGSPKVVWDEDGVRITTFRVDHSPIDPAVGYRFDYAGRSIVISGDTVKSPEIERMSEGVDLLVHEALAAHLVTIMTDAANELGQTARAKITTDILNYHTTPVEAAETAEAAGARHLLFYHIVPPLRVPGMGAAFLEGVSDAYSGDFTLGRDGVRVSLPANSKAIEVSGD